MPADEPRDHHYVPQFFLRNFAVDEARRRITTVAKHGSRAVWAERSIDSLGYERDLYVHMKQGVPISVEADINRRIETPIARSDTWAKIASGRTDALDQSDRPILYALIRHLEARTPHYQATMSELAQMAADANSAIPFADEERAHYAAMRAHPDIAKEALNQMASTTEWAVDSLESAFLMILRSPVPLRSSTTPVVALSWAAHAAMALPLPDMTPYQLVLTLNPHTLACLILGDFDGAFSNRLVDQSIALGFNRRFLGQFGHFDHVRHLITGRANLAADMDWAGYDLVEESERKITFRRRAKD
ncbi:MAG: hypothetical protein FD144_990 [Rhodospirillaceae bacterium]|nr:MAG: hypothetical protein FD144_990 [Rhodospirillaceae bacterium]